MTTDFLRFGTELDGWRPLIEHPIERRRLISFEPIIGQISGGIGDALQAIGVGADTAASVAQIATPALIGAGGGALAGALGGNAGLGALAGAGAGALYGGYNAFGGSGALRQMLGIPGATAFGGETGMDTTSALPSSQANFEAPTGAATDASGNPVLGTSVSDTGVPLAKPAPGSIGGSSFSPLGAATNSKGISNTGLALGALAALASALGKNAQSNQPYNTATLPGPSATAATQGPLFNAPANPTGYINRQPLTPTLPGAGYNMQGATPADYAKSYFNYGPEPLFFSNNAVNLGKPFARGGAAREPMFAAGGATGDVSGPGDGQSDSVPAKLRNGSFVFNADVVNAFGSGSSEAGKQKLEEARRHLNPKGNGGMASGGGALTTNARLSRDEVVWSPEDVDAIGGGDNDKGADRLDKMRKKVMSDRGIKQVVPRKVKKSPLEYLRKAA